MKTYTNRMKLLKESDDELIDQFATNWPILDTFAGGLSVANGVTPPDIDLYDGCIVREATSGKAWIARKDPITGAFSKRWLIYPWTIFAYANGNVPSTIPNQWVNYPITTVDNARCVNASAADITGGQIICPIAGIYLATLQTRWLFGDGNDTFKSSAIRLDNAAFTNEWNQDIKHTNNNIVTNQSQQLFVARDPAVSPYPVGVMLSQNSTGNRDCNFHITVELVSPR